MNPFRWLCRLHSEAPTMTTYTPPPDLRAELADLAGEAVASLVHHQGLPEPVAVELIEDVLDALIALPEPLESGSDVLIDRALDALVEALRRDPAKMQERAARVEARGNVKRAARIRARAGKAEARQA